MIGETVAHYRIVERIGVGGMGEVYKAEDLDLPRFVALKFLARDLTRDPKQAKRFLREAQAASALDHPNVCTVYEAKEADDGRMYIAMACYEGTNLRELLADGELAVADAVEFALAVADGAAYAHEKGIIHRDVKPANLMVTNDRVVKILDFGLAKLTGRSKLTSSGSTLGTLAYMSPEQTQDETVDARTDIYSLGVTLYEMITGICPFVADYEAAVVYKILNLDPTPMGQIRSHVPRRLERIVAKAIHKDKNKRYQRMALLRDDLLELLQEIAPSRVFRFRSLRRGRVRRYGNWPRFAVAGGVLAVAAVAAAINWGVISEVLGIGSLERGRGIAVYPMPGPAGAANASVAAGIGFDLTRRIQRLARFDNTLWVVPHDNVRKHSTGDPSHAMRKFGVYAVVTYSLADQNSGGPLHVRLLHSRTARQIGGFEVSTDSTGWHTDLNGRLADLLDVGLDTAQLRSTDSDGTTNSRAYETYLSGLGYLAHSDETAPDSALHFFTLAVETDPAFTRAHVGRARSLLKKYGSNADADCCREAISACVLAVRTDSSQAIGYEIRGRARSFLGDKEQALADFAHAVEKNERDPVAWNRLGWTCWELDRYSETEQIYGDAIAANPYYYGPYLDRGYFHYVSGKYETAVPDFEQVASLAPDHAPTYNYLGASFYCLELWEKAIVNFEKSFDLGKNYGACTNLGTLYYMDGRFEDAARMYEWAWEYDRRNYIVIGNLAAAYYWIEGERERALELYGEAAVMAEQSLAKNPDHVGILSNLAGYYAVVRPDTAAAVAERALALAPDDPEVLYRAADTYEQLNNRPRALVLLGAAIEHGYSVKEIEHEPWLKELRDDPRYVMLVSGNKPSAD
jgi:tetratricopeptide (TPR) repeat protein/tRNA A-37 threonylcarbamoyl transferase component Bud32